MNNFIDTSAVDLSRARTAGLTNLIPAPFPVLVAGRRSTQSFFFANAGVLETWSGDADYSLRVTVGNALSGPIAGVFSLSVDGDGTLTLPWDINAAGLQNALNSNATVAAQGGVNVIGTPGRFLIAYKAVGATSALTVNAATLAPGCTGYVTTLATGSATVATLLELNLRQTTPFQSITFNTTATPYLGWTGVVNLEGNEVLQWLYLNGVKKGPYLEGETLLTVEVIDDAGNATVYYQTPVILRALNYISVSTMLATGPSYNAQTSTATGNTTINPGSQLHTEIITFSGAATQRNIIVKKSQLTSGAQIDIVCVFDGVADGTVIHIHDNTQTGPLLFAFTKAGGEANAVFRLVFNGGSTFNQVDQIIPAYATP